MSSLVLSSKKRMTAYRAIWTTVFYILSTTNKRVINSIHTHSASQYLTLEAGVLTSRGGLVSSLEPKMSSSLRRRGWLSGPITIRVVGLSQKLECCNEPVCFVENTIDYTVSFAMLPFLLFFASKCCSAIKDRPSPTLGPRCGWVLRARAELTIIAVAEHRVRSAREFCLCFPERPGWFAPCSLPPFRLKTRCILKSWAVFIPVHWWDVCISILHSRTRAVLALLPVLRPYVCST